MTKNLRSIYCFFLLLLTPHLCFSQDVYDMGDTSFFIMKHREKQGVGYNEGYTTLAFWLSPCWKERFEPFIDARLHVFNDGRVASNLGVGCRFPTPQDQWALGWNFYYDFRNSNSHGFNQLSLGLEALSDTVDFRLNGYFPVSCYGKTTDNFLCFANDGFLTTQTLTIAIPSLYFEAGGYIPKCEIIALYGAVGPYYLFDQESHNVSSGSSWGGKARLSALVYDGIQLGVDFTYDTLFNARVQGYLSLALPFGPANMRTTGKRWKEWYPDEVTSKRAKLRRRLTQVTTRNEILPTINKCVPCTCPFPMLFVDNTAGDGGDGTMKSPYNSLRTAQEKSQKGNVIYVFYGDGTTRNYDTGFFLKESQTLAGSGTPLTLNGVKLPPLTPGLCPVITNCCRDVVHLSCFSTVNGFRIITPKENIGVVGCDVKGVNVRNNCISSGNKAILLNNVEKRSEIKSNQISNVAQEGIFIENSCDIEIENNCINHACSHGLYLSQVTNTEIKSNQIEDNNGSGIVLIAKSGTHLLNKNTIRNNDLSAIQIANTNNADFSLFGNRIQHEGANSSVIAFVEGSKSGMLINNNDLRSLTKGFDLTFSSQENAEFSLDMNNNVVFSGTNPGIFVNQVGPKLNKLTTSGTNNSCDDAISFMINAQHHSACLFNWSNNRARTFVFDNAVSGHFNVNAPSASQNGFVLWNNRTPVVPIGTINFQPETTKCP